MIKTISLIKRRPDLDRAAFRAHYESTHAPLALPHMSGLMRYVRYHVEEDLLGEIHFDVLSAFWYRDAESIAQMQGVLASEAGKAILEDELKFMDKPENTFFPVSERDLNAEGDDVAAEGKPLAKRTPAEEGDEHFFILVGRPESLSRYDGSAAFAKQHWPALRKKLPDSSFALLRDAFPMEGRAPRWDAVLQVRSGPEREGLEGWATALTKSDWRVAAVRTRRFETDLGVAG